MTSAARDPIDSLRAFFDSQIPRARLSLVAARKARAQCTCSHCTAMPSRAVASLPEDDDPPARFKAVDANGQKTARRLPTFVFRARKAAPSRYLEMRALDRLHVLGDVEELSPGHREALGLTADSDERASRANYAKPEPARVRRDLTSVEQRKALEHLQTRPVWPSTLKFVGGRDDWLFGVWLELVNPPAHVEQPNDLQVRIDRAVWRFEKSQKKQMPQTVLTQER